MQACNSPPCTYERLVVCACMHERLCACRMEGKGDVDRVQVCGCRADGFEAREEERAQSNADSFRNQTVEINQTQSKEREKASQWEN